LTIEEIKESVQSMYGEESDESEEEEIK